MKIISKFKDFYDYPVTGYDTDESIIYNRESVYYNWNEYPFNKLDGDVNDNRPLPSIEEKEYYNFLLRLKRANVRIMENKKRDEFGIMNFHIIGVYPEIHIIPIVCIFQYDSLGHWVDNERILNYGDPLEVYTEPNLISIEKLKLISEIYSLELSCKKGSIFDDEICGIKFMKTPLSHKSKKIEEKDLKTERPKFFKCLGSPVFYMSRFSKVIDDKKLNDINIKGIDMVSDCNFSELSNINLDWLKSDLTIRNRIENFIVESLEKPIPESDNKTKILSHGFDLKTSFRRM